MGDRIDALIGGVKNFLKIDHHDAIAEAMLPLQPPEVQRFANEIVDLYHRLAEERRPFELQWRLNQAFIAGDQYCDIYAGIGFLDTIDYLSETERRSVYNQLAPIVENRMAKLARVHPGPIVRPLTSDSSDVNAAKVSTRIIKAAEAATNMRRKKMILDNWMEQTGGVFMKTIWNPHAGPLLGYVDGKPVYEGEVEVIPVPYYELYPATSYEEDIQKQDYIIQAKVYTTKQVLDRWGVRLPGNDLEAFGMNVTGISAGGAGYNNSIMTIKNERIHDAVTVLEYWERPTREWPNGRHAILADNYCVHLGELDFRCGDYGRYAYPFAHQRCLLRPGVFWGLSVVERCIPLQRDYNATKNRENEYFERLTGGVLVYESGSIDDDLLDNGIVPGMAIPVNQGASTAPQWLAPEEVPASLPNNIEELRAEFTNISGVSEMSRTSQAPTNISSGTALSVLKEEDDTRLSITADLMHVAYIDVWKMILRLYKQFATTRRVSRVVGDKGFGDIYSFLWDQNDITSDDVTVDTINEMLNTPAQRKQLAMELLTAGLFNDPDTGRLTREGRAKLWQIFELGDTENAIDLDTMQSANAMRENVMAMYGEPLEIMPFDNHSLHQAEHMKFALGAEFRELRMKNRAWAQAFLDHLAMHKQIAIQEAMALSGAPAMVSQGQPLDTAVSVDAQETGNLGRNQ